MSLKSDIALLSPATVEKILSVVKTIEAKLELASKGDRVILESDKLYIADTNDFQITDRYDKVSALNKLVEWAALTYELTEQGNYLISSTPDEIRKVKALLSARLSVSGVRYKLIFYPTDGKAEYRGVVKPMKGKMRSLLDLLNKYKNEPFYLNDINSKCIHFSFKNHKNVWDTVNRIKEKLQVVQGEYFPVHNVDDVWIWAE